MAIALTSRMAIFAAARPRAAAAIKYSAPAFTAGASALSYHLLTAAPLMSDLGISALFGLGAGAALSAIASLKVKLFDLQDPEGAFINMRRQEYEGKLSEQMQLKTRMSQINMALRERGSENFIQLNNQRREIESQLGLVSAQVVRIESELVQGSGIVDLEPLGEGGAGKVYKGRSVGLKRAVVLKTAIEEGLSDSDKQHLAARLEIEARSQAEVIHPNIAQVYAFKNIAGVPYLIQEFIEGESLEDRINRAGGIGRAAAAGIALKIAAGLKAAHENGIIHRDLKPHNVMVSDNTVKIIDFGLSRVKDEGKEKEGERLTMDGTMSGTPEYMPPEAYKGLRHVEKPADIYSFGIMIYQMITGKIPYAEGLDENATMNEKVVHFIKALNSPRRMPMLPDVETDRIDRLQALIMKMAAKEAEERPTINVVLAELEMIAGELGIRVKGEK